MICKVYASTGKYKSQLSTQSETQADTFTFPPLLILKQIVMTASLELIQLYSLEITNLALQKMKPDKQTTSMESKLLI